MGDLILNKKKTKWSIAQSFHISIYIYILGHVTYRTSYLKYPEDIGIGIDLNHLQ